MEGQGIFDPDYYRQYRPFYPPETFAGLQNRLVERGFTAPFSIADIGCGTGHSSLSLLLAGVPATLEGIDPDPGMLSHAEEFARSHQKSIRFQVGSAENIPLPTASQDAILVGSAFHWMNPEKSSREFARVLKPRGLLRIFEYQFPKARNCTELNEWIRRRFNQEWRAPAQIPRGNFQHVTRIFRESSTWKPTAEGRPAMILKLSCSDLVGLILSQSRVFHYETGLNPDKRSRFRIDLAERISSWMKGSFLSFDFKLEWVEFGRDMRQE